MQIAGVVITLTALFSPQVGLVPTPRTGSQVNGATIGIAVVIVIVVVVGIVVAAIIAVVVFRARNNRK